ncbi:MAG: response regulator [Geobacteraceae bacterium]|nr:response regulator [Geobacteraceae bacterium]
MTSDFNKRLVATFRVETKERLAAISAGLIELEQEGVEEKRREIVEAVFREAHSLKGAARAVSMSGIESLCHAMESVFTILKQQQGAPSPALFDLLHRAIDFIDRRLLPVDAEPDPAGKSRVRELVLSLEKAVAGAPAAPPPPSPAAREYPPQEKASPADTVRISAGRLDSVLRQAEEMVTAKLAARQRAVELGEVSAALAVWEKEWKKVRPALRQARKARAAMAREDQAGPLGKLLEFCEWSHSTIKSLEGRVAQLATAAAGDRHTLGGMVDTLLDDLKEALMLPCATVLAGLPRMARDLAREQGKEVELAVSGETVEIDRRVLEELKDPLIHLIRNSVDHGIEKPAARRLRNKAERGRITVTVSLLDSGRIEIVVGDDGGGMDPARLAEAAIRQGIVPPDGAGRLGEEELLELAFRSGLSTSPLITDISGRGLGLAIVREKVENLGGTVTLLSAPGSGTTFRMVLPLTLSTFRGVLVRAGDQTLVVPAAGVETVARIPGSALRTVENRETVELGGKAVSFARLADLLQIPRTGKGGDDGLIPLFVIGSGARRIAIGVDAILDEQEVLVKSLGPQLSRVRNIAGATVLGTGRIATILHPGDLLKSAVKGAGLPSAAAHSAERGEAPRKSVLIVEDSITARTLLKNILESAGYRTSSAVDGIDALTQLKTEEIDLVVSDVDMPRLNGFELTARIRAARELAELPVVLVTSLDSREDRERGVEAGANAYIVKSSFDQSNLLEVVKRLI